MIEWARGNLLDAEVDVLVNTVNTVGIMGKGLALQFKRRFPDNFRAYAAACRRGEVRLGHMHVWANSGAGPRWIVNFPTKGHWRDASELADVEHGLTALAATLRELGARSVAVPPLGCGNGGLSWSEVRPRVERALAALPELRALVFAPAGDGFELAPPPTRPLTRGRAIVVKLIESYLRPGFTLTRIEIQKLCYLAQVAGEPLRLRFEKGPYGPFARNLNHVLVDMEGAQLRGVGDGSQRAEIRLAEGAAEQATSLLDGDDLSRERLERVQRLIKGFESPRGMELLATVHWVNAAGARTPADATAAVHAWSDRKHALYPDRQIAKAWDRLADHGWLAEVAPSADRPSRTG